MPQHNPEPASRKTGERQIAEATPHWWAMAQRLIPLTLVALVVFIITLAAGSPAGAIIVVVLLAGLVAVQAMRYRNTSVTLTDRRLTIRTGAFTQTSHDILLNRIEGVGLRQSPIGRMLGFGDLVISGVGGDKDYLPFLVAPEDFRRRVSEQIDLAA